MVITVNSCNIEGVSVFEMKWAQSQTTETVKQRLAAGAWIVDALI